MRNSSRDQVEFHLEADSEPDISTPEEDEPFRIALLGDFSGGASRLPVGERKPVLVDRDNFDAVLEKFELGVDLPSGRLAIRNLDHFHPDHIYSTHPLFRKLRDLRDQLGDPATFAEAASEILGAAPKPMPAPGSGTLLDQIVGAEPMAAKPARKPDPLKQIIEAAIRPHLVERADPRAPELIRQVDRAASDLMRAVLHHPNFQALEAAWRTLFAVVRQLETGTDLKVYIVDATLQELATQPEAVYGILRKRPEPWAVLAGNYSFGVKQLGILGILGKISAKLEAPFFGEADLSLLDGSNEWGAFRRTPEARQVSLAMPRVLLRLPYGKQTSACEEFAFEEVVGKPDPKQMLFGSPAFFCAMLLGDTFSQQQWNLRPGTVRDITGLPIFVYRDEDDESQAFPCAEIELTHETAEALVENGLIPMIAMHETDVVRVFRFQSVAAPPTAIAGRWQ